MRLYLVRHAESANNAVYGAVDEFDLRKPDPEITQTGHHQAKLLGAHLAASATESHRHPSKISEQPQFEISHLYCSLMTRSILTAGYIARTCGIKAEARLDIFERKGVYDVDPKGNEIGVSGPGRRYFSDRFPEVQLPGELNENGWWGRPVETDLEFFERVKRSLATVIDKHRQTGDRVAMVVHGDYIDQCINELMAVNRWPENYEDAWVSNWVFHNTSISRVDIAGDSRSVVYLNRIDHLPTDLVTW